MRTKKAIINIIANILVQFTSIIVGLLVPKLLIENYGSSINGLIQMMTQIISYFGIIEGGVATAAGAALYKPLLQKEYNKINQIMTAVKEFYLKTGIFFIIIGLIICIIYPMTIANELNVVTTMTIIFLLLIISISGYLIFNKYNMILVTDQKHYITLISSAVLNILVAVVQIILIFFKANIIAVVLPTPLLGIIRLLLLRKYVRKKYNYINYQSENPDRNAISQKWNALSLNVSQICKIIIPLVTLSMLFDLKVVSVYTVYSMIFRVGSSLIETIGNSMTAIFGNVIATEDKNNLTRIYNMSETVIILFIAIVTVCFYELIHPFIGIYIGDRADISYYCPVLAITFIINEAVLNIRFSPKIILKAKGILKQVSKLSILEIIICTILTPIFCIFLGFETVLFASILSGLIQSIFMTIYVYRKILNIKIINFIKKIAIAVIGILLSILIIERLIEINPLGYLQWGRDALMVIIVTTIIIMTLNAIFLRKDMIAIYYQIKNLFKRKKEIEV